MKIKPEIALKRSMNGKKVCVCVSVCVCVCVCVIQRISKSNGKVLLTRKKKVGKYYQCNSFFRTQKLHFKSCVYKLMHIHKMIHLVGTYSHPEAVKKLQF